jgi:hypothetical protein
MVPQRALAAQILVLHQVRSAPSWQPIATFPESAGALDDPPFAYAAIVPTVLCLAPLLKEWVASRKRQRHPLLPNRL